MTLTLGFLSPCGLRIVRGHQLEVTKHKHHWNMSARFFRSSMAAFVFHSESYLSHGWPWCSFSMTLCHVRAMVVLADNYPACYHIKRIETEPQYLKYGLLHTSSFQRDSSPKNENSVITSPSSCSKPVWISFLC